ncbi:unnamed protein product [Gadus morhua 'NCC']
MISSGTVSILENLHSSCCTSQGLHSGEPPEFLLSISGLGIIRTAESLGSDKRFSTELTEEKTGVDLKISSAAVTDSALYYCALRPTVTGNTDSL